MPIDRTVEHPPAAPTCALEGCDVEIVPHDGGGRPKRYCSDAHRAQARRRRLRGNGTGGDDRAARALEALRAAVLLVEEVVTEPSELAARLAEARAQATAQVLEAQNAAAEATRELVASRRRFEEVRLRLESELAAARDQAGRDRVTIAELQGALEGARTELEAELLRHHRDVQALEEERAHAGRAGRSGDADGRSGEGLSGDGLSGGADGTSGTGGAPVGAALAAATG